MLLIHSHRQVEVNIKNIIVMLRGSEKRGERVESLPACVVLGAAQCSKIHLKIPCQ